MKSREQRKALAAVYANELNTGNQIDQASTTNRNLKADANAQQPAPVNVNNTYENKKSSPSSGGGGGSDDTNPYERKKNQ
jgi:small-conductance mechanosensitive channel